MEGSRALFVSEPTGNDYFGGDSTSLSFGNIGGIFLFAYEAKVCSAFCCPITKK